MLYALKSTQTRHIVIHHVKLRQIWFSEYFSNWVIKLSIEAHHFSTNIAQQNTRKMD